jgi:hypothetical protein
MGVELDFVSRCNLNLSTDRTLSWSVVSKWKLSFDSYL